MNFPVMRLDNLATARRSNSQGGRKAANFLAEMWISLPATSLRVEEFLSVLI